LIKVRNFAQSSSPSALSSMARALKHCQSLKYVSLEDIADEFMIAILEE
jgi:hypothetical protein